MIRFTLRHVALAAALAATTAAWAARGPGYSSSFVPNYQSESQAAVVRQPMSLSETLSPNESVVIYDEGPSRAAIIVEGRRLTNDERIQAEAMDRIAAHPRVSGRIGVESRSSVVTLTGWTRTVGQARSAEREARGVAGVRYVRNQIRARVGGAV